MDRRTFLESAASLFGAGQAGVQRPLNEATVPHSYPGDQNIREEDHFGIINGHITVGVNYRDVAGISAMYAPPYASTDFSLDLRVDGRPVRTAEYSWTPVEVGRKGHAGNLEVRSETLLLRGQRSGMLRLILTNQGSTSLSFPLQFDLKGSFDRVAMWGFPRPQTQKNPTAAE